MPHPAAGPDHHRDGVSGVGHPREAELAASLGRPAGESSHVGAEQLLRIPPPLGEPEIGRRRSPAEEARTVVALSRLAALATVGDAGDPWSSVVGYGLLPDGTVAMVLSTLAEHGRNVAADARVSLSVAAPVPDGEDPLDASRVTLAGRVEVPGADERAGALEAYCDAYPAARAYARFGDFTLYVVRVERVRWVGGFGRMDWASGLAYAGAEPDPTAPVAQEAVAHLNADHADALVLIARELAAYDDATSARCDRIDRYGLDLTISTPRGAAPARVGFPTPVRAAGGLRAASVELVLHARSRRDQRPGA